MVKYNGGPVEYAGEPFCGAGPITDQLPGHGAVPAPVGPQLSTDHISSNSEEIKEIEKLEERAAEMERQFKREEGRRPVVEKDPGRPTAEEIEEHCVTHTHTA